VTCDAVASQDIEDGWKTQELGQAGKSSPRLLPESVPSGASVSHFRPPELREKTA
jgi:hypothetical protein